MAISEIRYASLPRDLPVALKIEPTMIAWPTIAIAPYGRNANPYTA